MTKKTTKAETNKKNKRQEKDQDQAIAIQTLAKPWQLLILYNKRQGKQSFIGKQGYCTRKRSQHITKLCNKTKLGNNTTNQDDKRRYHSTRHDTARHSTPFHATTTTHHDTTRQDKGGKGKHQEKKKRGKHQS
jgi:hypothetical protein